MVFYYRGTTPDLIFVSSTATSFWQGNNIAPPSSLPLFLHITQSASKHLSPIYSSSQSSPIA